jgi:4-hydroxyphenylpyruvate dioxygenase-like putative hemolysin
MQQTLQTQAVAGTSRLIKIDHVTFVVRPDTIRKWAWF